MPSSDLMNSCFPEEGYDGAMDFAGVLDRVEAFLTERGGPFALAGGVALAVYGNPRLTLDLDIVTEAEAQEALVAWMESAGYATLHRSSGFSNHRHPSPDRGRVDFMKAGLVEKWEELARGL